jgi:hypothetical protein
MKIYWKQMAVAAAFGALVAIPFVAKADLLGSVINGSSNIGSHNRELMAALESMRHAKEHLKGASGHFGPHLQNALDQLNGAANEVVRADNEDNGR